MLINTYQIFAFYALTDVAYVIILWDFHESPQNSLFIFL